MTFMRTEPRPAGRSNNSASGAAQESRRDRAVAGRSALLKAIANSAQRAAGLGGGRGGRRGGGRLLAPDGPEIPADRLGAFLGDGSRDGGIEVLARQAHGLGKHGHV